MKLVHKLFGALLLTSTLVLILMVFLLQWLLGRAFLDYVREQDREQQDRLIGLLVTEYKNMGSWDRVAHNHRWWSSVIESSRPFFVEDQQQWDEQTEPRRPRDNFDRPRPGDGYGSRRRDGQRPRDGYGPPPRRDGYGPRPRRDGGEPAEDEIERPRRRNGDDGPPRGGARRWGDDRPMRLESDPPRRGEGRYWGERPRRRDGQRDESDSQDKEATPSNDRNLNLNESSVAADNSPRRRPPPPRREGGRWHLYDKDMTPVMADGPPRPNVEMREIRNNDELIGWLGVAPRRNVTAARDINFLKEQTRVFYFLAGMMMVLAAVVSTLMARGLTKRLTTIAQAARRLATGDLETRIPVNSKDELGRLALDFNHLARELDGNERARRRWTADISHELRTPLAVMQGELEAVKDGIRPLNEETLDSLYGEVKCLNHLVSDLYELSLSDIGAMNYKNVAIEPYEVLREACTAFKGRLAEAGLTLEVDAPEEGPEIFADPVRLHQLFTNLMENSRRYTDAGGVVRVSALATKEQVFFVLEDSAPGVSVEDCEKLFERYYRESESKVKIRDGAGLGLAICRNIVEAHQGTIKASPSSLGGLCISIQIPLEGVS